MTSQLLTIKQWTGGRGVRRGCSARHASATRGLSAELQDEHGLTINDYECLLLLSRAEGGQLRRVDLSRELLLTPSGITRLLEGLERQGYVERRELRRPTRASPTPR